MDSNTIYLVKKFHYETSEVLFVTKDSHCYALIDSVKDEGYRPEFLDYYEKYFEDCLHENQYGHYLSKHNAKWNYEVVEVDYNKYILGG